MSGEQYITPLVTAVSDAVVARLAAAGYPALVAGKILLGDQYIAVNDAPPKIVFVPNGSRFSSKDVTSNLPLLTSTPYTADRRAQLQNRSVLTEEFSFEVHCWATTTDKSNPVTTPDADYNFTRALYHAIIAACDDLARGAYVAEPGAWTRQGVNTLGREFVFGLTFQTPVLTELLPFVPPGVAGQATIVPDGSTGDSVVIPLV